MAAGEAVAKSARKKRQALLTNLGMAFAVLAYWGQSGVPADINEDGVVDIDDLFAVLAAWGPCP